MEQTRKIIICCILFVITLIGCATYKSPSKDIINNYMQIYSIEKFDSICKADTIPSILEQWHKFQLKDFESKLICTKYLYIKDKNSNLIYIIDNKKIIKRYIEQ